MFLGLKCKVQTPSEGEPSKEQYKQKETAWHQVKVQTLQSVDSESDVLPDATANDDDGEANWGVSYCLNQEPIRAI